MDLELEDYYRSSWTEYFKEITIVASKRSSCSQVNVGCILVKDNRIISMGYNGFLPNLPYLSIIRDNIEFGTIHAEQNAIIDCAKRGVNCSNSEAYITHFPCINCFKILLASGITKIYYINDYKNDQIVYQLSIISNIPIIKI